MDADQVAGPKPTRRWLLGAVAAFAVTSRVSGARAEGDAAVSDPVVLTDPTVNSAAEEFVAIIARDLLNIAQSTASNDDKKALFQTLLETHADIPTIAVFSLGQYASRLADEERERYYTLVAGYISRIFVTHSTNLAGRAVRVTGSRVRSESETLVESKVWFDSGEALPVVWRVIATEAGLKVFDVSVNGIWLAIQQRAEFVSVIQRHDGELAGLLAFLDRNN
jgi:phospholipid transport system substrate-binding protein